MQIIDCHSHLLSLANYPRDVYAGRYDIPIEVVAAIDDALKECKPLEEILALIGEIKGYHLAPFVKILNSDIPQLKDRLLKAMGPDGCAVVNMLDLEIACGTGNMPLSLQLALFEALQCQQIIPFYNIDPRRPNFKDLVLSIPDLAGFKMYPPLGYCPDAVHNATEVNDNLKWLYSHCNDNNIPIVTHCSTGGIRGKDPNDYADPKYFENVLWDYDALKIDFAHYGAGQFTRYWLTGEKNWASTIHGYMQEFPTQAFADVAFHDQAVNAPGRYFEALNKALETDAFNNILFGSDWPLHVIDYPYSDIIGTYKKHLSQDWWEHISYYMPRDFIGADRIPSYIDQQPQ